MGRIAGFDCIRGIAAVVVVFTHTAAGFMQIGAFAVNSFFVLSGYLIIANLRRMRARIEAGVSGFRTEFSEFWKKRAARIMPAYYMALALSIPIAFELEHMSAADLNIT